MDGLGLWICLQNKFLVEAAQDRDDRPKQPDPDQNFFLDTSGILVQRGFRKSVSRKIWFSKNLDIKILKTKELKPGNSVTLNRHGLDHDR